MISQICEISIYKSSSIGVSGRKKKEIQPKKVSFICENKRNNLIAEKPKEGKHTQNKPLQTTVIKIRN